MTEFVAFFFGAAIILTGTLGVVLSKNAVHSALFLIQTLMGVAILFVIQDAHFLAAVQVVVYAGAVVILFLFVIMLLGVDKAEDLGVEAIGGQRPLAAILGASLLAAGTVVMLAAVDGATGAMNVGGREWALDNGFSDIERFGRVLFTDYVLAFEITAALLTIAVISAVVLTRSIPATELLDDLEPGATDLGPWPPFGANDGDRADDAPSSNEGDD